MSVPIHVVGSSHVRDSHHLPASLSEVYEFKMDESFQLKYYPGEVQGVSGGRLWNVKDMESFLSIGQDCAKGPGYIGQVIVIMMGTNDWADPTTTAIDFEKKYRDLVDNFLDIPSTCVMLTGLVPRGVDWTSEKRTDMRTPTKIVKTLAANYTKAKKMVRFIPVHKKILDLDTANQVDGMKPKAGSLVDKVHMAKSTAQEVAQQILNAVRMLPKNWFVDYSIL